MLHNWLEQPILHPPYHTNAIGQRINVGIEKDAASKKSCYLIGDGSSFAKKSCAELFALQDHFSDLNIYHLGHLKKQNAGFAISPLQEALNFDGKIIFITENDQYLNTLYRSIEPHCPNISLGQMSAHMDQLTDESNTGVLKSRNLYNLSCLGFQRHFCPPDLLKYLHETFVNHLSFGQIAENINQIEPIIRALQGISIDSSAILGAPIKPSLASNPNGLNGLQICQIAKYCGMSNNLRLVHISNNSKQADYPSLVGQMIWYLLEGMALGEEDHHVGSPGLYQEHLVRSDYLHKSLRFWKSLKTNRWWFEIPSEKDKIKPNIYPCSLQDYQLATKNELSTFILSQINHDH